MTIQLRYDEEFGRYVLRDTSKDDADDFSYEMVINHSWNGESWYRYRFIVWNQGEWFEAYTKAEFDERVQAIADNEGEDAARIWQENQTQVWIIQDNHPVFALRNRWEAMMALRLFDLPVDLYGWQGKPASKDLIDKMNACRQKWQEEESLEHEPNESGFSIHPVKRNT